jgi:drug/metabolite transporter (DMT)-like permease
LLFRRLQRGRGIPFGTLADATFGAAAFSLVAGWWTDPAFTLQVTWPAHGWLIAAGVGPQVIGWTAILYALPRLPGLETSIILLLQPVLTTVWAALLLAEYPSWLQLIGVTLVLAGVAVVSMRGAVTGGAPGPRPALVTAGSEGRPR